MDIMLVIWVTTSGNDHLYIAIFIFPENTIKTGAWTHLRDVFKKCVYIACYVSIRVFHFPILVLHLPQRSSISRALVYIMMMWHLLWFVPYTHVILHLENNICMTWHLCSITVLFYRAVLSHIYTFDNKLKLQRSEYCTWTSPYCDQPWCLIKWETQILPCKNALR